jgi:hypothetical protein
MKNKETLEEVAENNYYFESDIEMVNFISEMASTGKIPNRWSAFVAKINELYLFKQEQDKNKFSEKEVIKFAKYCAELKVYDNKTYVNNTFEMLLQKFKNK